MSASFGQPHPRKEDSVGLIQIEDLTKCFGATMAVDDISLAIREGEFFCLLGPSGCGKTTLLRLLAGFEEPSGGRIRLDGRDLIGTPPHRRPLNTVFQSYALFPHLTVSRNVAYGLAGLDLDRDAKAARVAEMLRLVRLEGLDARYPAQISGGQRQRVALARALARRPRVLLLDEPLSALDRRLREETAQELKGLQHRLGTTFVMVTHDQAEAMAIADRIGLMDRGRLVQVDAPRTVYERPATRFVASFLGDVNLIEGTGLGLESGRLRIETGSTPILHGRADQHWRPGDAVTVAIRPEKLRYAEEGHGGLNGLPGHVASSTYLGATVLDRVAVADGLTLRLTRAAGPGPAIGAAVILTFDPSDATLLRPTP